MLSDDRRTRDGRCAVGEQYLLNGRQGDEDAASLLDYRRAGLVDDAGGGGLLLLMVSVDCGVGQIDGVHLVNGLLRLVDRHLLDIGGRALYDALGPDSDAWRW